MADIQELYQKFLAKQCSREEVETLLRYFRDQSSSEDILALIQPELDKQDPIADDPADLDTIHHNRLKLRETIQGKTRDMTPPVRTSGFKQWIPYAAAMLICFTIGIGFYWYNNREPRPEHLIVDDMNDIEPGGNRATITLDNGQTLTLSEEQESLINKEGTLTYADGSTITAVEATQHITLSTPRAGQYAVTLSDGTKVWLNSSSQLIYPSRFDEGERVVQVKGEAYFEVAHMERKPFVVKTELQNIEVLGTKFNVKAYSDEAYTRTTLMQGSVQVSSPQNPSVRHLLEPGEQGTSRAGSDHLIDVRRATYAEQAMSWKNGEFVFDGQQLAEVMRDISRWYDVEIRYVGEIPKTRIGGQVAKNKRLSDILKTLEKSSGHQFTLQGKEVSVTK